MAARVTCGEGKLWVLYIPFFPFSPQENQSFGLETFSWACKGSYPSVLKLTWLQFPNQCPISKGNPPNSTPCPGFPPVGSHLGLLVFEMLLSKLQLAEPQRPANSQPPSVLHRAGTHARDERLKRVETLRCHRSRCQQKQRRLHDPCVPLTAADRRAGSWSSLRQGSPSPLLTNDFV